jgi:hypothetical protein
MFPVRRKGDQDATATHPESPATADTRPLDFEPFAGPEPGVSVGRYTLREPLGAGGMGEVYLAQDPELDRLVAVKLISPDRLGENARARSCPRWSRWSRRSEPPRCRACARTASTSTRCC